MYIKSDARDKLSVINDTKTAARKCIALPINKLVKITSTFVVTNTVNKANIMRSLKNSVAI